MSEVKNEGLEVVATLTVSFDEGDGGSAIEQVETHTLLDEGAHDLCRHSEALAVIAGRDARIAELELLAAAISADCNDMANERNQFRAELAAAKETISRYETTAENYDVLRAELANQLEVKAFWFCQSRTLEVELAAPAPIPDADHSEDVRAMVVPEGYKLVPIMLTPEMITVDPYGMGYGRLHAVWSRLLSASPAPGDSK